MTEIPSGFKPLGRLDDVMDAFAPVYLRREEDDRIALGFPVGPQHCNPRGHCHGGTWATMADVLMGMNVGVITRLAGPTISLNIDFLSAAQIGQWAEGRARVLRWTPNLGFAECQFTADGEIALRASAIFRRKQSPYKNFDALIAQD